MASTYLATKAAAGIQPKYVENGTISLSSSYTFAAAFVINDVITIGAVPAGATIQGIDVDVPSLDTSTGVTWSVGDASSAGRFIANNTSGRSSTGAIVYGPSVVGSLNYTYAATTPLQMKITAAPTSGATSGTINFVVQYSMDA